MKAMKMALTAGLIGLLTMLSGCGLFSIEGSGQVTAITSNLDSFTRVSLADACQGAVTCGPAFSVTVRIDDNLTQYVRIAKTGATLSIGLEPGHNFRNFTFAVEIVMPALEELNAANAASAVIAGFPAAGALSLNALNASEIQGVVNGTNVILQASNASSLALSGAVENLTLTVRDASQANLSLLSTVNTQATIQDASSAGVRVSDALTGSVNNASHLSYTGSPASVGVSHDISSSLTTF